jgi:hypothetical protein
MRHNLLIKDQGSYRNKKGTTVFRYSVHGKPEAIEAYEDAQGEYFVQDEKLGVLYFTPRYAGKTANLVVNDDTGKVYVDDSEMQKQASVVSQYGGNLGQAMAEAAAKKLMGGTSSTSVTSSSDELKDEPADTPLDEG